MEPLQLREALQLYIQGIVALVLSPCLQRCCLHPNTQHCKRYPKRPEPCEFQALSTRIREANVSNCKPNSERPLPVCCLAVWLPFARVQGCGLSLGSIFQQKVSKQFRIRTDCLLAATTPTLWALHVLRPQRMTPSMLSAYNAMATKYEVLATCLEEGQWWEVDF